MITRLLILINILAYAWEVWTGALRSNEALYAHGALLPAAVIQDHQWWRIVSSAFLHGNIVHIGVNMLSLYWLGRFIEMALGSARTLLVYIVSMIAAGLAVVYFAPPDTLTVGASGAIFGLFGALFAIGLRLRDRGTDLVRSNVGILVINLVYGFTFPGIAWQAHIGGLIAGFILTFLIFWPPQPVRTVAYDTTTGAEYDSQLEQ